MSAEATRRAAYAQAFIEQARSDWRAYELLAEQELPPCHALHYLQMSCEKLGKAYRIRDNKDTPVDDLTKTHGGFVKFVGTRMGSLRDQYAGKLAQFESVVRNSRALAREIEKLAPATDRNVTPENTEYPWERAGAVVAPCNYSFPAVDVSNAPGGRAFLKFVVSALNEF